MQDSPDEMPTNKVIRLLDYSYGFIPPQERKRKSQVPMFMPMKMNHDQNLVPTECIEIWELLRPDRHHNGIASLISFALKSGGRIIQSKYTFFQELSIGT